MRRATRRLCVGLMVAGSLLPAAATAQQVGETIVIREPTEADLYAAGAEVDVRAFVTGDAVLAGGKVIVTGDVAEDLLAAGGEVTVSGAVGDDARLAGGSVTLAGPVTGHAVIAGGEVRVGSGARITDWAWLAGGRVVMAGEVTGDLTIASGSIELDGQVGGDVELTGGEIRIGRGAVIDGDLVWRSNTELVISDGAIVRGEIRQGGALPEMEAEDAAGFGERLFVLLSVVLAAGILHALFQPAFETCTAAVRGRFWHTVLVGLGVFAVTPVVFVLLLVTGLGWLLGLLVLLAYGLGLILGSLTGLVLLARLVLARRRPGSAPSQVRVWLTLVLVVVLLQILYLLPPIGGLAAFVVLCLGLGGVAGQSWRRLRGRAPPPAVT